MKRIYIYLASLLALAGSFTSVNAKDENPNRILVIDNNHNYKGYVIDYTDQLLFKTIEGEVKAEVEILDVIGIEKVMIAIQRTKACQSYKLSVVPKQMSQSWDALSAISYVESNGTDYFYEDFAEGSLTGMNLKYDTDYYVITVGYDLYGTAVGVCKAPFSTPQVEIVGEPYVEAEVIDVTMNSFTISFTPNDDVSEYYYMAFEEDTWWEYLAMWGPPFGCDTISELIELWFQGMSAVGPNTVVWDEDIAPGQGYDVIIAVKDLNGNFVPHESVHVTTESLGGSGEAFVEIELGEYEVQNWWGEMLPSQFLYFWPNEETARYRIGVYYDYEYDRFGDLLIEDLEQYPPYPNTAGWWMYDPLYTDFQIDPSTTCYAIVVAQNANEEWGEPNVFQFTTPDECPGWSGMPKAMPSISEVVNKKVDTRMQLPVVIDTVKGVIAPKLREPKRFTINHSK